MTEQKISVTVVFGNAPRAVQEFNLRLAHGSTLADALQTSTVLAAINPLLLDTLETGIWGRPAALSTVLRDLDRVELYRPLLVDPKVARRERFVRQGAKSAGLFAKRRAGAKAGY